MISTLLNLSDIRLTTFIYYVVITYTVVSIASMIFKAIRNSERASRYKKAALKKRTERDQQLKQIKIPAIKISESLREKILNSDATTLLEMLKSSQTTSEEILITYFQRAITIGLEYELITEVIFNDALVQARKCDKLRKENPAACKGALFGLPMSLKDMFIVKGTDNTCGLSSRLFDPSQDDGYLVKILKGEGAIPFIKSNIPQAIISISSQNNIWGTAKNPYNKERGCGASSGGEAGLIAARCSPLGIGNDIGGSLRTPPLVCGVVGFKPTGDRVTRAGTTTLSPMFDYAPTLRLSTGPITKSARDASLLMKALLSDQAHQNIKLSEQDPHYVRLEWKEEEVFRKHKNLRIGYFKSIDYFPLSPANARAIDEAVDAMKKKGYQVVEIEFLNLQEASLIVLESILADGGASYLRDELKGEPAMDSLDNTKIVGGIPGLVRNFVKPLLNVLGEKRLVTLLDTFDKKNAYEYIQLIGKQDQFRKTFFKIWEENKLDALISPGLGFPAAKHGVAKDIMAGLCYGCLANVFDLPTGALPVTLVREGEDDYPKEIAKHNDLISKKAKENMQGSVGLPVGVQVSTLPWQDEKCVNIMIQLEEELQFRKKHPFPI